MVNRSEVNFHIPLGIYRVFEREREDIAKNKNRVRRNESNDRLQNGNFEYYWSNSEINRYLTQLTLFYGDICHTETLGKYYLTFDKYGRNGQMMIIIIIIRF